MKDKILDFFNGVTKEMKKVTWPTREELKDSTVVVIVSTIILSLFVFVADFAVMQVLKVLLGN